MAGGKATAGRGKGRLLTEGESCDEGTRLSTGDTFITIWQNMSPVKHSASTPGRKPQA